MTENLDMPKSEPDNHPIATIENLLALAKSTRNALYVWEAILQSFMHDLTLPPMCMEYIKFAAIKMSDLIEDARSSSPKIKPGDALNRLPLVFQMASGKKGAKNAFARLVHDETLRREASLAEMADLAREFQIAFTPKKQLSRGKEQTGRRLKAGHRLNYQPQRTDTRKP